MTKSSGHCWMLVWFQPLNDEELLVLWKHCTMISHKLVSWSTKSDQKCLEMFTVAQASLQSQKRPNVAVLAWAGLTFRQKIANMGWWDCEISKQNHPKAQPISVQGWSKCLNRVSSQYLTQQRPKDQRFWSLLDVGLVWAFQWWRATSPL